MCKMIHYSIMGSLGWEHYGLLRLGAMLLVLALAIQHVYTRSTRSSFVRRLFAPR